MTFRHHWRKYTLKSSNLPVYLYILISLTVYFNIFNQLSGLFVETGLFLLILSALSKVLCLSYLLNFIIDFNSVMPLHVSTTSSSRNRMMQTKRNYCLFQIAVKHDFLIISQMRSAGKL